MDSGLRRSFKSSLPRSMRKDSMRGVVFVIYSLIRSLLTLRTMLEPKPHLGSSIDKVA